MSAWSDWKHGYTTDEEFERLNRWEHRRDNEEPEEREEEVEDE